MNFNRKVDLSVYYYLQDLLPALVNVYDGYPVDETGQPFGNLVLPAVASDRQPIELVPYELAGLRLARYSYIIDIYGKNKAQRDDIAYTIQTNLDEYNIPVNDYDEGFPPAVTPTQLGSLIIDGTVRNRVVYVFPRLSPLEYWRAVIDFTGYFSPLV
jgi:hypothetical protein